mmetsp:Transcript_9478/g.38722  ORF Transcript_9478/g.38722 Transcript_9478/m.38722 type:complete len:104 (+) Transcript_9478:164-475(+)
MRLNTTGRCAWHSRISAVSKEALPHATYAVMVTTETTGLRARYALDAMFAQARLFDAIGRVEEAKALLDKVHAASTRLYGPEHEETRKVQRALGTRSMGVSLA